ncbi:hypothetical protein IPG36_07475 [bacterium]|nr:MAG: hypothetical protein IPG36_07475 [bacterium]
MLGFGLLKLLEVAYDARLQHEISSHRRATITSVSGFILEILSIGLFGFFGLLAQLYGTLTAFGWIGGGVTIVGLLYIGKKFRDK